MIVDFFLDYVPFLVDFMTQTIINYLWIITQILPINVQKVQKSI